MNKKYFLFILICFLTKAVAQNKLQLQKINSENKPWTYEHVNDHKNKFNFVVVTDRTGGERKGIWQKGIDKIKGSKIYPKKTVKIFWKIDVFLGNIFKL